MASHRERLLHCATALLLLKKKETARNKEVWVKDWLKKREDKGSFSNICRELSMSRDEKDFRLYVNFPQYNVHIKVIFFHLFFYFLYSTLPQRFVSIIETFHLPETSMLL